MLDAEGYMAMGGVAARNALSSETRPHVLAAVYQRETRQIVRAKAETRLRILGQTVPQAEEASPEASPGEIETAAPAAEAPAATPLNLPDAEAVNRTRTATSRLDELVQAGVTTWACRVCGVERPLSDWGKRNVGGVLYMQPRCGKCRNKKGLAQRTLP